MLLSGPAPPLVHPSLAQLREFCTAHCAPPPTAAQPTGTWRTGPPTLSTHLQAEGQLYVLLCSQAVVVRAREPQDAGGSSAAQPAAIDASLKPAGSSEALKLNVRAAWEEQLVDHVLHAVSPRC